MLLLCGLTPGWGAAPRTYDLPAGEATRTLRLFAEVSDCEILFAAQAVRGVTTNAVRGEYTALEALDRMLAGTRLQAMPDEMSAAIAVRPIARTPGLTSSRSLDAQAQPGPARNGKPQSEDPESMKNKNPITLLATLFALVVSPGHSAESSSPDTGMIEGRVFNAATGQSLANARVTDSSSGRETMTDASGGFRLAGVPTGKAKLVISYIGMESEPTEANVSSGSIAFVEVNLRRAGTSASLETGVIELQQFRVVEDREMAAQAIAINEQRNSANIKNVVARDEYDYRGNENIGDFLGFLPGVGIVNSGIEPQSVSLRGLPSSTTGLLLDGGEIASSQGGQTREINLREVPMVNVSRVEVTKVPTPDMPASGLGGSINLITRSGFETKRRRISYNLYAISPSSSGFSLDAGPRNHRRANSPSNIQPSFDLSYLQPVSKSLALSAGLSRTWRQRPMWERDNSMFGETATWNLVNNVQTQSQWASLAQLYKTLSGQFGVDWQLGPRDLLSASFQYREYSRATTRSGLNVNYGAGATGSASHTQGAATGVGSVVQGLGWDTGYNENRQLNLRYRHKGDLWTFNANGSISSADAYGLDIDNGHFRAVNASINNLIIRGEGIGETGGILPTRYIATSRSGAAVDLYNGGLYAIPSATSAQNRTESTRKGLRLDLSREFPGVVPLTLKIGAAVDQMQKDLRGFSKSWTFRPNGASDAASRMAGNFDVFDEAFLDVAPTIYGQKYREISNERLYDLFRQQPSWFILDEALAHQSTVNASRELEETVTAAFVRADLRLMKNRLWLVTGVRFEETSGQGRGPLNDINAQYQRSASGEYIRDAAGQRVLITTDGLALRQLRFQERGASGKMNYHGFYPSLNATYNVTENLIVRAAYARTLGRPDLSFIIPGATVSEPDIANPTVRINNPQLKPWTANGYDLTLEAYDLMGGTGSIGVFQKDIEDFFGTLSTPVTPELLARYGLTNDGSFDDYTIVTTENAGDARIRGLEFNFRQALTFLPSWARGSQVFFNATRLKLEGSNTADFAGFKPSYYAAGINFIRPRYYVKMTYTYEGETRLSAVAASASIPEGTYNYQGKRERVGLSAQYSLSERYSLYLSLPDIGGFTQLLRRYAPTTPEYARDQRLQNLGYYTTVGIRGTF